MDYLVNLVAGNATFVSVPQTYPKFFEPKDRGHSVVDSGVR